MKRLYFSLLSLIIGCGQVTFGQAPDTLMAGKQVDSLLESGRVLLKDNKPDQALQIARMATEHAESAFGKINERYAKARYQEATCLVRLGRYQDALPVTLEVLGIREKTIGNKHLDYAYTLNRIGSLYDDLGQFAAADPYYRAALILIDSLQGKESEFYLGLLNNLAILYLNTGDHVSAEKSYTELLELVGKKFGEDDPKYANTLNGLATLYFNLDRFLESEPLFLQAHAIWEKNPGKESIEYSISLNNLGILYMDLGQSEKAEGYYRDCLHLRERLWGRFHPRYAETLNGLGNLMLNLARYGEAEKFFLESLFIKDSLVGKETHTYAHSLNNLGICYQNVGRFAEAEQAYLESKTIREKTVGNTHLDYAGSLNNLAVFYNLLGQYDKAELMLLESLSLKENSAGSETANYAESLNNLANFYKEQGRYAEAEQQLKACISIFEKSLNGRENPECVYAISNLANLYSEMGEFSKAENLFLESKAIHEKILKKNHPDYAELILNNLALLYERMGRIEDAKTLLVEARSIIHTARGETHPAYVQVLNNLGRLLVSTNQPQEACRMLDTAALIQRNLFSASVRYLSEEELYNFTQTFQEESDRQCSYLMELREDLSRITTTCFDNTLFYKGFLRQAVTATKNRALSDTVTANIWYAQAFCLRSIVAEYTKPIADRDNTFIAFLEQQANEREKQLARKVAGFGDALSAISWQDVQQKLRPDEATIEFVSFVKTFPKTTDSTFYAALLLRPGDTAPSFIPLCEEKQILVALRRGGISPKEQIGDIYRGKTLHALLWQPLEPHLAGVKTVHFSPSGLLHSIAFAAIPTTSGQYLADRYELRQYGSTRELVTGQTLHSDSIQNARVYGGIRYDSADNIHRPCNDDLLALNRGGLGYLPCSPYEMRQVQAVLTEEGIKTDTLSGFEATEETMKPSASTPAASPRSPDLLHISTHGAYLPQPEKPDSTTARPLFLEMNSPLARSFLAFANAGAAFRGQPRPDAEDGLLTAFEISSLDLSGTKLAVLSACETALGDIQGSEGVYGLQRAFKIAGVEHLIVSLWKVEDSEATIDFMTTFYRHFFGGLEVREAFDRTQKEMRVKYISPYLWAAFVLI